MTNSLFKVTLALLSLISAVLIGQTLIETVHQPSSTQTEISFSGVNYQPPTAIKDPTTLTIATARVNQVKQNIPARLRDAESAPLQFVSNESTTASDSTPARQQPRNQEQRRSFSFHYLDILEWMFAGRNDKAKPQPPQRPSTSLSTG